MLGFIFCIVMIPFSVFCIPRLLDRYYKFLKKPVYRLGKFKYCVLHYPYKTEIKNEADKAKRSIKCEINRNTITKVAFWIHIINFIFLIVMMILGIIENNTTNCVLSLTTTSIGLLNVLYCVLLFPIYIGLKMDKAVKKEKKNMEHSKDKEIE